MSYDTVIVGGGAVGGTLASALEEASVEVAYLDENTRAVERAVESDVDARPIESSEVTALDRIETDDVDVAIAASSEDSRNLLVAQLMQARDAQRVVALVNDPDNLDLFVDAGVEPVCVSSVLVSALNERRRASRASGPTRPATADETAGPDDGSSSEVDA